MRFKLIGTAAIFGMLAIAFPARADLIVEASTDNFANPADTTVLFDVTNSTPITTGSYSGTIAGFVITMESGTSNTPGSTPLALLGSTTLDIMNSNATTSSISFRETATDYTMPSTAPLLLTENLSGTVYIGGADNSVEFQGYANTSNTPFGMGTITPGPITTDITGTHVFSNSASYLITSNLPTPFSLTKEKDITLSAGSSVNFATSLTLTPTTATPEPSTIATALIGLALVGGYRLRRRAK